MKIHSVMLVLTLVGCAFDAEEEFAEIEEPLIDGVVGPGGGGVARFKRNGAATCSATLFNEAGASSTEWALTAEECVPSADDKYSIETPAEQTVDVENVYFHPVAEDDLGTLDNHGKVDVVLLRLASAVMSPISNIDGNIGKDLAVRQDSAARNGVWQYSYQTGIGNPHATLKHVMVTNIATEAGDFGGPVRHPNGSSFLFQGIASPAGVSHGKGFRDWLRDARRCGPFDISEPNTGFCTTTCRCGAGEGDCDSNSECGPGLVCTLNQGAQVGLPPDYEICLEPTRNAQSTGGYCESIGGCGLYEGDCNTHDGCRGDLICRRNIGHAIGMTDGTDVCDLPRMPNVAVFNAAKSGSSNHCTVQHPCALGDGDCDVNNHDTCRGFLNCKADVGSHFGFSNPAVDVCVHPSYD